MYSNFNVTGILQLRFGDIWHEQPVCVDVAAANPADARRLVLTHYEREARARDWYAFVRWYSPDMVRVNRQ